MLRLRKPSPRAAMGRTLPSSGHAPAYGLRMPLMSFVGPPLLLAQADEVIE